MDTQLQRFSIPEISDEQVAELGRTIYPVVERDGKLYRIEPVDPRKVAFTWLPTITDEAPRLEQVAVVSTLHEYAASVFFKPSIAEVLAQIPPEYLGRIVAFKTNCNPDNINEWPDEERIAMSQGFHTAKTTLYAVA